MGRATFPVKTVATRVRQPDRDAPAGSQFDRRGAQLPPGAGHEHRDDVAYARNRQGNAIGEPVQRRTQAADHADGLGGGVRRGGGDRNWIIAFHDGAEIT